ncbi:MAG: dihydrolipoyl dehydrogenase [Kiritimatiellia bacterium]|jgi:dihydrolipoamide dehydrogenase|nr:dihydrolipoyl dehydrogenase [Kiritimatiellia bacterium]MDD4175332.1 dihydrolipoyl dehydrogenase [Kiritimatiellia bacterium]MDD4442053.1 dihydrolipoyl dehydrogenase [Kiritimatiellia bacterium]MDX9793251.1 dihydrolipoyl dehydrogenase [Kiritimatiellia bacterium]NLC83313.1 dihydrolipoyl dehydrogenase [Lentisphaerota bacterium]
MSERHVDVAVIGAGTAGLVAASEIRKVTDRFVIIQDGPPGTTCARVGCMPSKALIQIAHDFHRRSVFDRQGIRGAGGLTVDTAAVMRRVRELRDRFAGGMVKRTERYGARLLKGRARFLEPTLLEVDGVRVHARRVVIATGSRPRVPDAWRAFGDRLWTSDTFFEKEALPASVAVIGLGVIGLELGQAMARLGVEVLGVARSLHLGGITDPVVRDAAAEALGGELTLWRGHPVSIREENGHLVVCSGGQRRVVDAVLAATGRQPNVDALGLETLNTPLRKDGVPEYDAATLQVGHLPVFMAGDANADHPVLHEAWDDGLIAGRNAVAEAPARYQRRTPLHIVFSDPNIASVGCRYAELDPDSIALGQEAFSDQPRAVIRGDNAGVVRLYGQPQTGRLLGAEFCVPGAEHLAHLLAWCIQQRMTVREILHMPFYHPVLEEGVRAALEDLAAHTRDGASDCSLLTAP